MEGMGKARGNAYIHCSWLRLLLQSVTVRSYGVKAALADATLLAAVLCPGEASVVLSATSGSLHKLQCCLQLLWRHFGPEVPDSVRKAAHLSCIPHHWLSDDAGYVLVVMLRNLLAAMILEGHIFQQVAWRLLLLQLLQGSQ